MRRDSLTEAEAFAVLTPPIVSVTSGDVTTHGDYSPGIYVSGANAGEMKRLSAYGLNIRVIDGGIGSASALKMSYAGITKGVTAIGAALLLGASRAGVFYVRLPGESAGRFVVARRLDE